MNYTDRVAKGAATLDEILPGWERKIDLEILDLQSGCNCPLGQLSADILPQPIESPYEDLADYLCPKRGYEEQIAWEVERGFLVHSALSGLTDPADWDDLTEAWKRLIRQRLEA